MKFLGAVDEKGLYASWNEEYGQIRFYLDGQEIAVFDTKKMRPEDPILFKNDTIANELSARVKEKIQNLTKELDIQEFIEQEKDIDDYRNALSVAVGIDEKEIISSTEISLDEKVVEKEEVKQDKTKDKEKSPTIKDVNAKQEISLNAMATSTKTIGQILKKAGKIPNIQNKKFDKLLECGGIITQVLLDNKTVDKAFKDAKTNTTRFSFVLESTDGTLAPIDLEQDYSEGNNPREIGYRTNADGTVEQDDVNSRYKIGNNDETLSIKTSNGPGNIEIGYSSRKTLGGEGIEGNESIDHELATKTVYYEPRTDSREQEYSDGIRGTEERAHEAYIESKHQEDLEKGKKGKVDDNHSKYKDIDGDEQTKNDNHQFDIVEEARKIRNENDDVEEIFTEAEVIEMIEKSHDEGKEIEEIEEEIKTDASMMRGHRR